MAYKKKGRQTMILKIADPNTGRWKMYESAEIELGKTWLGLFPGTGDRPDLWALYDHEVDRDEPGKPTARRAPMLLENPVACLFVPEFLQNDIITSGARRQINIAVIHRQDSREHVVAFGRVPAYLMNQDGRTIEKL